MHVTEVDIVFVKPKDGLVAFASVVLDDQIFLSGIAVHQKLVGCLFRRIRKPIGLAIEQAIFDKLKDVMSKRDVGHDRSDVRPASV